MKYFYLIFMMSFFICCGNRKLKDDPEVGNTPRLKEISDLKKKYKDSNVRTNKIFQEFYFSMSQSEYAQHLNKIIDEKLLIPFDIEIRDTLQYSQLFLSKGYKYTFQAVDLDNVNNVDYQLVCILEPKFFNSELYELSISLWGVGFPVFDKDKWQIPNTYDIKFTDMGSPSVYIGHTFNLKYYETYGLFDNEDRINRYYWIINNLEIRLSEEKRSAFFTSRKYLNGVKIVYRDYFIYDANKEYIMKTDIENIDFENRQKKIDKKNKEAEEINEAKKRIKGI